MVVEKSATGSLRNPERIVFVWLFALCSAEKQGSGSSPAGMLRLQEQTLQECCGSGRHTVFSDSLLVRWPLTPSFPDLTPQALFTCLLSQEWSQDQHMWILEQNVFCTVRWLIVSLKLSFHMVSSGEQLPRVWKITKRLITYPLSWEHGVDWWSSLTWRQIPEAWNVLFHIVSLENVINQCAQCSGQYTWYDLYPWGTYGSLHGIAMMKIRIWRKNGNDHWFNLYQSI